MLVLSTLIPVAALVVSMWIGARIGSQKHPTARPAHCESCGYDVGQVGVDTCPECGTRLPEDTTLDSQRAIRSGGIALILAILLHAAVIPLLCTIGLVVRSAFGVPSVSLTFAALLALALLASSILISRSAAAHRSTTGAEACALIGVFGVIDLVVVAFINFAVAVL